MPIENYGVLKGRPVDKRPGVSNNAHYQILVADETTDYRLAINVKSDLEPSEVEYLIDEEYEHPMLARLLDLPLGYQPLRSKPGGEAVDFIRGNMFDPSEMRPLPFNSPGADNDLNEKIDKHVGRAMSDENALVYAFGQRWGPEKKKDTIFGFLPGNGIHDIHMNQGNVGKFVNDDGVWQDGCLLFHFPDQNQWVGVFLKFQSQAWHTDDRTGHTLMETPALPVPAPQPPAPAPAPPSTPPPSGATANDGRVRIVVALVNQVGPAPEHESVTIVNASPGLINLNGWQIADRMKNKHTLSGQLAPGATKLLALPPQVQLGNQGGIISVLDPAGLKVDGVSYTGEQVWREGWTIVFR